MLKGWDIFILKGVSVRLYLVSTGGHVTATPLSTHHHPLTIHLYCTPGELTAIPGAGGVGGLVPDEWEDTGTS